MDVSKYKTVAEWYADVRGRVPVQMPQALERLMKEEGLSFPEAYARLASRGAIVELDEPGEPPTRR